MLKYMLAVAGLVAAGFGCGPRYVVVRETPQPPLNGRVSVEVADRREPKKGGADPAEVGIERSGWGIPYPVRLGGPAELAIQVHDIFAEAANSLGIGVLPIGNAMGATSRLVVEVQTFWCDGYPPVYKATAVASATIVDGASGQVRVPGQPLEVHTDAGSCHQAVRRAMRALYSTARGLFANPQLQAALVTPPAAPPPPSAYAPPSGPDAPPPPPPAASAAPAAPSPGAQPMQPY